MGPNLDNVSEYQRHIYSVSELSYSIKDLLEQEYSLVWVRGQVSNLTRASSGHIYFTLRDEYSSISAVWFKSYQYLSNQFDSPLSEGQEIVCAGRISSYPPRGIYQIVVELIQDIGVGKLYLELERLKKKLKDKGYFDPAKKKTIPKNPNKVAVITSLKGAAIRDFLKVVKEKKMPTHIRIYPSTVQGIEAENKIVEMIELANDDSWAEVLVIIRGGGSIEDLYVFNSEKIATAIYESRIPVVTGIGHEIDYTIADMVADLRCATPTHVANNLWDDNSVFLQQIDELSMSLNRSIKKVFDSFYNELNFLLNQISILNPYYQFNQKEILLYDYFTRMNFLVKNNIINKEKQIDELSNVFFIFIKKLLNNNQQETSNLCWDMYRSVVQLINNINKDLNVIEMELHSCDPLQPLKKGYALVKDKYHNVIRDAALAKVQDRLEIVFYDGSVNVLVEK